MEPFLPDAPDPLLKLLQPWAIARDAVVSKVALKFLAQLLVLLRNRPVPIVATPLGDPFESPTQALTGCLVFDDPLPSMRLAPVVGKAKEIEGSRFVPLVGPGRPNATNRVLSGWTVRPYFPKRFGSTCNTFSASSRCSKPMTTSSAKRRHERPTSQSWDHLLSEPQVEDIMEIDVTEQR